MAGEDRIHGQPLRTGDPEQLGDYRLKRRLGEGGMGSVYLAETGTSTLVAVKLIRADLAEEPEFRRRFRSEVERAREVPPFCTAEVLDADPDHETPYLVVEFVDGPSLSEVVVDRGPLTPSNLHALAIGVATALTAIHGAGVIHRDLKPSNVLLAPGAPKVIDFGIARAAESTDGETRTDQLIGTVAYMAPERLDPMPGIRSLTSAADIFAWGAVVTFAATGRVPFVADSSPATAVAILTQEPDLEGLTEPLRSLVGRALAKNPKDRPTARELLDALLSKDRSPAAVAEKAAEDQLTDGMAAAKITIPKQAKKRDRTRVGKPDDVIETDIIATPQPRSRVWRRIGVAAMVLVLLAMAGTLAAIVHGDIKLPISAAVESANTPLPSLSGTGSPAGTPTSTPSPTPSDSPATDPIAGWSHFRDALAVPAPSGAWENRDDPKSGANCTVDGGLTVTLAAETTYRCPGKVSQYTDFRATVDVTLLKSDSCAAIWFHLAGQTQIKGYVLQVCADSMTLMRHFTNDGHTDTDRLETDNLIGSQQLAIGDTRTVEIDQVGRHITAALAGTQIVDQEITADSEFYASGRIVLGMFQPPPNAQPGAPPSLDGYQVKFENYQVWWPAHPTGTVSPSATP